MSISESTANLIFDILKSSNDRHIFNESSANVFANRNMQIAIACAFPAKNAPNIPPMLEFANAIYSNRQMRKSYFFTPKQCSSDGNVPALTSLA